MARQRPPAEGRRWYPRAVLQMISLLAVAVLFSLATAQAWNTTTSSVDVVATERVGVAYLRPLTALIGELTEAQSTAVRGGDVQVIAVNGAINNVDSVDRRYGARLTVHERWTETRKAINEVITANATAAGAFDQYGEVVALVRQLVREIADTSMLVLDRAIDSDYLATAAISQLPDIIIGAGRASDLAALGGTDQTTQTQISVARYNVAVLAESIGVGVAKALDNTDSRTLGVNITGQLDAFRSAVDSFVPSGTRLRSLDPIDGGTLARTATTVRQAARPLSDAVIGELDSALAAREDTLGWQRLRFLATTILGLVAVLGLMGWLFASVRTREVDSGEHPAADEQPSASQRRGQSETALIDPRDLLAVEEMMHAGGAVGARRGERGRDAR
jgi:hypothetical protein